MRCRSNVLFNFGLIVSLCVISQPLFAAAFPTLRDPYKWPFAATSIWNMPIGSNAQFVFGKIKPAGNFSTDENIIIMTPDQPQVPVYYNNAFWNSGKTRCSSMNSTILDNNWPIPPSFTTEGLYIGSTPNAAAACLMSDKRTIHQNQPFHRCGPGGKATSGWYHSDRNQDIYTGNGIKGGHGTGALSSLGGTVRLGELVPGGVIRHALAIALYSADNFYPGSGIWPANANDGDKRGSVPQVREGSLLALKSDFDTTSLLTEPGRIIARAFMNYGGYINDDTNWPAYYIDTEWGPAGRVIDEFKNVWGYSYIVYNIPTSTSNWGKDMLKVFTNLYAIANNSASSIGGGGTPRQPLAPAFGQPGMVGIEKSEKKANGVSSNRHLVVMFGQENVKSRSAISGRIYSIRGEAIKGEISRSGMPAGIYIEEK